jgi:DnaJ-class molecular chaperone
MKVYRRPKEEEHICPRCNGMGEIAVLQAQQYSFSIAYVPQTLTCSSCMGTGVANGD